MPDQQMNGSYIRSISILFTALLAGQIIFASLALVLVYTGSFKSGMPNLENVFFILAPALIIAGRLIGNTLYKKKIEQALSSGSVKEKLDLHRAAFIQRCALLEGPVLFSVIAYLLTNKIEIFFFVAGGIFLFYKLKPTAAKLASELSIDETDIS